MEKKMVSVLLIVSFLCYFDGFLLLRGSDEMLRQFEKARTRFTNGQYIDARNRLERLTSIIHEKELERRELLGHCFLLLGAIYEKEEKKQLAEENYTKARDMYEIRTVEGVKLQELPLYRRVILGESPNTGGLIEKSGKAKVRKKRKFPWLLVLGGVAVTAVVVILLISKKKKTKEYTLTVNRGEGVEGSPSSGAYTYAEDSRVDYNYSPSAGYGSLKVQLDGADVSLTGSFVVSGDHTLTAAASLNQVSFKTDTDHIQIDEGGEASFFVRLTAQPSSVVSATINMVAGSDTDIRLTVPDSLIFDHVNYASFQVVTLAAAVDGDELSGEAVVRISAPGLPDKEVTVTEQDQSLFRFETDKSRVEVPEGGNGQFQVWLSERPSIEITATVVRAAGGDTDITVLSGASLTFTPDNWHVRRTVVLHAEEDPDALDSEAKFRINSEQLQVMEVTAVEVDNEKQKFILEPKFLTVKEGDQATFGIRLSADPGGNLAVSVTPVEGGDPDISVLSGGSPVFSSANWQEYQFVTVGAAEDADILNGNATLRISAPDASPNVSDESIPVSEEDNDPLEIEIDTPTVTVVEGGDPASFQVKLSAEPGANVTLLVERESGDSDISVTGGNPLVFNTGNWDDYQTVTLSAARDDDTSEGSAVILIRGDEVDEPKRVTAVEQDTGPGERPDVDIKTPGAGGTVADDVYIHVKAYDDIELEKIELYVDNALITQSTASGSTTGDLKYTWSTRDVVVGPHAIRAVAYDKGGQQDEKTITVTVEDSHPTVFFDPEPASPLTGTVSIGVGAQDYRGVERLTLRIGGAFVDIWEAGGGTDVAWTFELDTTAYANGQHQLLAIALDTGGRESFTEVTVTINN